MMASGHGNTEEHRDFITSDDLPVHDITWLIRQIHHDNSLPLSTTPAASNCSSVSYTGFSSVSSQRYMGSSRASVCLSSGFISSSLGGGTMGYQTLQRGIWNIWCMLWVTPILWPTSAPISCR